MRLRRRVWLGGALAILGLAVAAVTAAGGWHPSDTAYPRQGIDVSNHQGVIARLRGIDGRVDWNVRRP